MIEQIKYSAKKLVHGEPFILCVLLSWGRYFFSLFHLTAGGQKALKFWEFDWSQYVWT